MIRINRSGNNHPFLKTPFIRETFSKLQAFYSQPANKRAQQKFKVDPEIFRFLLGDLSVEFNGKCVYCEHIIPLGLLDHFRPMDNAKGFNNEFSEDHYWWLALEWQNMYYACANCIRYKQTWFPVKGSRAAIKAPFTTVLNEYNLLIDPCHDNPEDHLYFENNGMVSGASDKGYVTIEVLKLNRDELVKERLENFYTVKELISEVRKNLNNKNARKDATTKAFDSFFDTLKTLTEPTSKVACIGPLRTYFINAIQEEGYFGIFLANSKTFAKVFEDVLPNPLFRNLARKNMKEIEARITWLSDRYERHQRNLQVHAKLYNRQIGLFIDRIEISNFKSIKHINIPFPEQNNDPSPLHNDLDTIYEPWLMLLGENGVGKSSFLQAVALTLMGRKYLRNLRFKAKDFLSHEATRGYVKIFLKGSTVPLSIFLDGKTNTISSKVQKAPAFLLAYGSTRLFPSVRLKPETGTDNVRARNLFFPEVALADAEKWLKEIHRKAARGGKDRQLFSWTGRAIKDLLLLGNTEKLEVTDKHVCIRYSPSKIARLDELSDGYKSVIILAVDIMKSLIKGHTTIEAAQGVVLIDEIGTHLHPRWKMLIVHRFRKVFPKVQFIATTHDPLCLRGLKKGEVAVFTRDKNKRVHVMSDLPDPAEFRVEQLLSSEFFGLNSTRDADIEEAFNEYYYLLSRKTLNPKQQTRLDQLTRYLKDKQHLGSSYRDELLYKTVDKLLAETKSSGNTKGRLTLETETIELLKEVYKDVNIAPTPKH